MGRRSPGNLARRGQVEFANRLACAWGKFHKHRQWLMNKHVSVHRRLKLFQAVVSPTMLFGLTTLPMTKTQVNQLDATQRRMLRSIAGWTRCDDEGWNESMRRVNAKLESALLEFPVKPWSEQFAERQFDLACRFAHSGTWPEKAARWDPTCTYDGQDPPRRAQGRPKRRWDDFLNEFSQCSFHAKWWKVAPQAWSAKRQDFIDFVCS